MDEAVAGLLALNLVVTMMLVMSLLAGQETREGSVRYAAQEAAAVAASHLYEKAALAQQREAQEQATAAARRALFGICGGPQVEMLPAAGSGPWRSRQVAVEVTCDPDAAHPRSARGLAWLPAG